MYHVFLSVNNKMLIKILLAEIYYVKFFNRAKTMKGEDDRTNTT